MLILIKYDTNYCRMRVKPSGTIRSLLLRRTINSVYNLVVVVVCYYCCEFPCSCERGEIVNSRVLISTDH